MIGVGIRVFDCLSFGCLVGWLKLLIGCTTDYYAKIAEKNTKKKSKNIE